MTVSTEAAWYALHEPLRYFIRKRVADDESAEDILQEVFLRVHMHIDQLREEEKVEGWIYQVARNLIIDHYRKHRPVASLEDAEELLPTDTIPEEDVRAALIPALIAMVNCLPSPYREALFLTDYQGLSQKELAIRSGISFSGAKSRVQRGREKLRQLLLDCCHFEFDRRGRMIDYQPHCTCCSEDGCAPDDCSCP